MKKSIFVMTVIFLMSLLSLNCTATEQEIMLKIDSSQAIVNGISITLEQPAVVVNSRTMIPVRFVSETLEAKVDWSDIDQKITISLGKYNVELKINDLYAKINNQQVILDTAPFILNNKTLVPIRAIAEGLGANILWDEDTQTITITKDSEQSETAVQGEESNMMLIKPDNSNLLYAGRIDFTNPAQPELIWSGSSFAFQANTKSLKLAMNDAQGSNMYNVFIDHNYNEPIFLKMEKGLHIYDVVQDLPKGNHIFEVFKRTEVSSRSTQVIGIYIDKDGSMDADLARPNLKMEFFGDSITSGSGVEDTSRKDNGNKLYENNFFSYASVTARNLGAEYHCISRAGIALTSTRKANPPMSDFYDKLNPYSTPAKTWDFSLWTPDIVVINLFQNDMGLGANQKHIEYTDEAGSQNGMVDKYVEFVKKIRVHYPDAYIVCALGNMSVVMKNSDGTYKYPHPEYVISAVQRLNGENDDRVYSLIFDYKNTTDHPIISEQNQMAESLTDFIKKNILPQLSKSN